LAVAPVGAAVTDCAVRVRSAGRRGAHGTGPDLSVALRARITAGTASGVVLAQWVPAANRAACPRAASRTFVLRKSAAGADAQSVDGGVAARRAAAARCAAKAAAAASATPTTAENCRTPRAARSGRGLAVPAAAGCPAAPAIGRPRFGLELLDHQGFIRHSRCLCKAAG
jgi:hypothetical protein